MKKGNTKEPVKTKSPVKNTNPVNDDIIKSFQMLLHNPELMFQFLDLFPVPVEIFTPDGTSVFVNRAILKLHNIPDASLIIGKYNLLKDPVCNKQMGLKKSIQRAFRGEATIDYDIDMPVQNLVDRGLIDKKAFEKSFMDFYLYPVKNNDKLVFVVFVHINKKLYYGRPDLARAKEYMDTHWKEEFDFHAVAKYVNMSVTKLYSLFHKHTGMTPGDYYRICKVEHIKENLADKNLSVKEVFAVCGEDSRGAYAKVFKKLVGLSPAKYREGLK